MELLVGKHSLMECIQKLEDKASYPPTTDLKKNMNK